MLHPKKNRIDYGEQLIPPVGYELDYAVGTTYSLDLEALMMLPVALFYAEKLEGSPDDLRYDMLEAITKSADKIKVFYQNGQLKVPLKYHHLMAYWEKGIQPVTMLDYRSSFHPKVWVVRYISKEDKPKYRVLVTSRNLTFARDWDIAFSTDGIVTDIDQPNNKPLIHFLKHLNKAGKTKIPNQFIKDLIRVEFENPDKFESFRFVPIGIPDLTTGGKYINPLTTVKSPADEMLIVSPFLDKTTLTTLSQSKRSVPYLLSRKEELDRIPEETLNKFNCWQFSKFFLEAEYYKELEDGGMPPLSQNLHAKLFIYRQGKTTYWYLGSANCSDPAQGRNVEFMVELMANSSTELKVKSVFSSFTSPPNLDDAHLFIPYDYSARLSSSEQDKFDSEIRKLRFQLSNMSIEGKISLIESGSAYDLAIEIDASEVVLPNGFRVEVKPLPEQQKSGVKLYPGILNVIKDFTGYAETALSIFLEFEIIVSGSTYCSFLLPMEIELPESRLNKIFSSIINTRDKFLKYLTFLLTGEESSIIEQAKSSKKLSMGSENGLPVFSGAPVFEKMLIAASRYPEKLKSIDGLIERLKSETIDAEEPLITAEFESFWSVFQSFVDTKN